MKKIITGLFVVLLVGVPFSFNSMLNSIANLPNGITDRFMPGYPAANYFIHDHIVFIIILITSILLFTSAALWRWRFAVFLLTLSWLLFCPWQTIIGAIAGAPAMIALYAILQKCISRRRKHCIVGQAIQI
jgi:hypothetical protein